MNVVQLQFCRLELKFLLFQKPPNEKVQKFSWNTEALLIHFPIFSSPCGHPNTAACSTVSFSKLTVVVR